MSNSRSETLSRLKKIQDAYRAGLAARIADIRDAADSAVADPKSLSNRLLTLSHDLAGSGGALGLPEVSRAAAAVEQIAENAAKTGRFTAEQVGEMDKAIAELRQAAAAGGGGR